MGRRGGGAVITSWFEGRQVDECVGYNGERPYLNYDVVISFVLCIVFGFGPISDSLVLGNGVSLTHCKGFPL
jgi:hypothetical protein